MVLSSWNSALWSCLGRDFGLRRDKLGGRETGKGFNMEVSSGVDAGFRSLGRMNKRCTACRGWSGASCRYGPGDESQTVIKGDGACRKIPGDEKPVCKRKRRVPGDKDPRGMSPARRSGRRFDPLEMSRGKTSHLHASLKGTTDAVTCLGTPNPPEKFTEEGRAADFGRDRA